MELILNENNEIKPNLKIRHSNLELFRIIVMVFIIMHHYVVNSGLMASIQVNPASWQSIFLILFGGWGKIGINCFVMITGFFMCKSNISLTKFLKLVFEIWFYDIIIGSIFLISGKSEANFINILNLFIPFRNISANFSTCFLFFYLLIPFLNVLIKNLNQRMHLYFSLLLFLIFTIFGTLPTFNITFNYVGWFCAIYIFSSYISLYSHKIFSNFKFWIISSIVLFLIDLSSMIVMIFLGLKFNFFSPYYFVSDCNTILAFLSGVSFFMLFKNLNIKNNIIINTIASTMFGVLLIHANCDAMREFLWIDLFKNVSYFNSNYLPLHALITVTLVLIVCIIIDLIRIYIIEKPLLRIFNKSESKVKTWYHNFEDKLFNKLNIK